MLYVHAYALRWCVSLHTMITVTVWSIMFVHVVPSISYSACVHLQPFFFLFFSFFHLPPPHISLSSLLPPFLSPFFQTQILKNWHLAVYVLVLVIIDLVMLIAVTAVPAARSIGKLVPDQENPGSTNVWRSKIKNSVSRALKRSFLK